MKILPVYAYQFQTKNYNNNSSSKIQNNTNATISFGEYWVRDIEEKYKPRQDEIARKIDDYFKTLNGGQLIAVGEDSRVYELDSLPGMVVKHKNDTRHKYDMEARSLREVSEVFPNNAQKYIATVTDEDTGKSYIISTKAPGREADPITNPWTPSKLNYFFNSLIKLDKAALWHGDLSSENILLEKTSKVNLIDYEWTRKLDQNSYFGNKTSFNLPSHTYLMNSAQFEMSGLPKYILKFNDTQKAQEFFAEYLKAKAQYHANRMNLYNSISINEKDIPAKELSRKYDKAQYEVLKNPSYDVMKVEAKKVQFLNAYRQAFRYQDEKNERRNILAAPAAALYALSCIQDYRKELEHYKQKISDVLMDPQTREDYDNYIKSMEEYGEWWLFSACQLMQDLGEMPIRHMTGKLEQWEGKPFDFDNENVDIYSYGDISNILPKLGEDFKPEYTKDVNIETKEYTDLRDKVAKTLLEIECSVRYIKTPSARLASTVEKKHIENKMHNQNKDWYNLLTSYYVILKHTYDYDKSLKQDEPVNISWHNMALDATKNTIKLLTKITASMYRTMFHEILQDGPESGNLTGYNNMEKFQTNNTHTKNNIDQSCIFKLY